MIFRVQTINVSKKEWYRLSLSVSTTIIVSTFNIKDQIRFYFFVMAKATEYKLYILL